LNFFDVQARWAVHRPRVARRRSRRSPARWQPLADGDVRPDRAAGLRGFHLYAATSLTVTALDTNDGTRGYPRRPVDTGTDVTLTDRRARCGRHGDVQERRDDLGTRPRQRRARLVRRRRRCRKARRRSPRTSRPRRRPDYNPSSSDPVTLDVVAPPAIDSIADLHRRGMHGEAHPSRGLEPARVESSS